MIAKAEFEQALASTGKKLDEIQAYSAEHRQLRSPFYPVPQRQGVTGVAANFAFVLTGLLHLLKPSWLALAFGDAYSATSDPKFATSGFDAGYLTFKPGTRASLFYWTPTAEPYVIALDERLKDTVSGPEALSRAATHGGRGRTGRRGKDQRPPLPPMLARN